MTEAIYGFSGRQSEVSLRSLERLDVRLLVHANHGRVFRWIQVQPDDVRGFRTELRIGRDAPTSAPLELNPPPPQDAPDVIVTDVAQGLCQQTSVPLCISLRRRRIQQRQNAPLHLIAVFVGFAGTRSVR